MSITAIAGLPGSGKSRLIQELRGQGFMARDDMNIDWDASTRQLREWLAEGKRVAVSDIAFVMREWRERLERELHDIGVRWEFFANDPHKCIRNVVFRVFVEGETRPLREEIGKIRDYSKAYHPPVVARPVVLADSTPEGLVKFYGSPELALARAKDEVAALEAMLRR